MAQLADLSEIRVLLLATILATESDLDRLQIVAAERKDILTPSVLYRLLLTFLPTDVEDQTGLVRFLQHLQHDFRDVNHLDLSIDLSAVDTISESEGRRRIHDIRVRALEPSHVQEDVDDISNFLIRWLYQLEAISGLTPAVVSLIDNFVEGRPALKTWRDACLIPMIKLQNEFYPGEADSLSLGLVEELHGIKGVQILLQFAERRGDSSAIGRDLSQVVSPWVRGAKSRKRRRIDGASDVQAQTDWSSINEWLVATSSTQFELAVKAALEWPGPVEHGGDEVTSMQHESQDPSLAYVQAILAIVLCSPARTSSDKYRLTDILQKAAFATTNDKPGVNHGPELAAPSKAHLQRDNLISRNNPLTWPSDESFALMSECVSTQDLLQTFRLTLSVAKIVEIALFGSEEVQKQELNRILQQVLHLSHTEADWKNARNQILQLHSQDSGRGAKSGNASFLGRVPKDYVESKVLDALLSSNHYATINDVYLRSAEQPLPRTTVKGHIVATILNAYDNASNANRNRGSMKKASDLLRSFQPYFQSDEMFKHIDNLIKAAHSMSFYQLTLQHGVPFVPVNIRVQHDPLVLIEKILQQNSKAYTKLDDLLEIGRNLVKSALVMDPSSDFQSMSLDERVFDAEHRVTYLAITSALDDGDFDTAYSYITTRLSTSTDQASSSPFTDDTSWRAAYAGGKHRPAVSTKSIHSRINNLSKRMDLLSVALTLAPTAEPLSEILAVWRRSEEEMEGLKAQALEEERALESHSNLGRQTDLPGGFGLEGKDLDAVETRQMQERRLHAGFSPTYEEQAPMGLFDVAKGAASAFRKSAFPLGRGTAQQGEFTIRNGPGASTDASAEGNGGQPGNDLTQTRRKRDVVSGIVTGGLVSGMSWVLGAAPASPKPLQQNHEAENGD